jgi:hypothetical protein
MMRGMIAAAALASLVAGQASAQVADLVDRAA